MCRSETVHVVQSHQLKAVYALKCKMVEYSNLSPLLDVASTPKAVSEDW